MLETYFSKDICNLIKNKLITDYIKYKVWCNIELKWVYVWKIEGNNSIKCPNDNNHSICLDTIQIDNIIKANNRILYLKNIKNKNNIIESNFHIVII